MRKMIVAVLLFLSLYGYAQKEASSVDERIHLHFNKPAYVAGDTIWFKAYLFAELKPSEVSTNFFIDLVNKDGQVISPKKYPVFNGTAVGSIALPLDTKEDIYIMRAYTPNILNNDAGYIYTKAVTVFNPSNSNPNSKTPTLSSQINSYPNDQNFNLEIKDQPKGKYFEISSANLPNSQLSLQGYMFQYEIFNLPLNFTGGKAKGTIPVNELPSGILHLLITDGKTVLLQKPVLINNKEYQLPVELRIDTFTTASKAKNIFSLLFPADTLAGSFSISVTDADKELYPLTASSIQSAFLIDEKMDIIEMDSLEKMNNKESLLLSKQWMGTPSRAKAVIDLKKEPQYIRLSGQLSNSNSISELNLSLQTKDSSSTHITVPISTEGYFERDNLIYYDTATLGYDQAMVGGHVKVQVHPPMDYSKYLAKINYKDVAASAKNILDNPVFRQRAKMILSERNRPVAGAVKKNSSRSKDKNDVNERYASGLFAGNNARSIDLLTNPPKRLGQNIFDYVQGEIAGLRIDRAGGGYSLWSNRSPSTLEALRGNRQGSVPVKIFLNEGETSSTQISSIPINQIALVKYFAPGNIMLPGIGLSGVFVVYTKKAQDINMEGMFTYPGYSTVHTFYQPDYSNTSASADKRDALYWEPNLIIQPGTKSYSFSFYNSDEAKRFHVIVQGFTADGKLIYIDRIIENKTVKGF